MRISLELLEETAGFALDTEKTADLLTMGGIECLYEKFIPPSGVSAVKVREMRKHPDADRLSLCDVEGGNIRTTVVCGAPNVKKNGTYLYIGKGGFLPAAGENGLKIEARKIRGVISDGMLLSQRELFGKGEAGGLWEMNSLTPGSKLESHWKDKNFLDVYPPANRPDLGGALGLAIEIALLMGKKATAIPRPPPFKKGRFVRINSQASFYSGSKWDGLKFGRLPLQDEIRLLLHGMRPLGDLIDITNLVLLKSGAPVHFFDLDKLNGEKIVVRHARPGETFAALDGRDYTFKGGEAVIADGKRAVAIAGIVGGRETAVGPETSRGFLEVANFSARDIAKTATDLGINTESSSRFRKGVPLIFSLAALCLVSDYLSKTGARLVAMDIAGTKIEKKKIIEVSFEFFNRKSGLNLSSKSTPSTLRKILSPQSKTTFSKIGFRLTPPSYRSDLLIREDIVEEFLRLYGYGKIPEKPLRITITDAKDQARKDMSQFFLSRGFIETLALGFRENNSAEEKNDFPTLLEGAPVSLANPMGAETKYLRRSLFPDLLTVYRNNRNRQETTHRIFERGTVFEMREGTPYETTETAFLLAGRRRPAIHSRGEYTWDDAKGILESLLGSLGVSLSEKKTDHGLIITGKTGPVALLSDLSPFVKQGTVFGGAIHAEALTPERPLLSYGPYPYIVHDLSLLHNPELPYYVLTRAVESFDPLILNVEAVARMKGPPGFPDAVSTSLRITYGIPDRTLEETEVEKVEKNLIDFLGKSFQVHLRPA